MSGDLVRPGPASISAGAAPGGIVIHVYDVPTCMLLLERRLVDLEEAMRTAEADGSFVDSLTAACCVVAYDGDSGERIPLRALLGVDRL